MGFQCFVVRIRAVADDNVRSLIVSSEQPLANTVHGNSEDQKNFDQAVSRMQNGDFLS